MLQLLALQPELLPYTTRLSSGLDAIADPMQSSVAQLVSLYFRGSVVYSMGPLAVPAADASLDLHNLSTLALSHADNVASVDIKVLSMAQRAHDRRLELVQGWDLTASRPEVIRATKEHPPEYNQV